MSSFDRIAQSLPALYAPEKRGDDELSRFLGAAADCLDVGSEELSAIMQTHWFRYADSALYNPWFRLTHERANEPLPRPGDADVKKFPYIYDLGRLAALFGIKPWQEGSVYSESVEACRKRIGRLVALWRNGLGTVNAVRGMVEASLPLHVESGVPLIDLPFSVEENPCVVPNLRKASIRGIPNDMVGPLMRWRVTNDSQAACAPIAYIQGVSAIQQVSDETSDSCIELYSGSGARHPNALAYSGTIQHASTLRIRPAYASLCGREDGVILSSSVPAGEVPAAQSPMATWLKPSGAPPGNIVALCQTADHTVWAAVNQNYDVTKKESALWSYNGSAWKKALDGLDFIYDLSESRDDLLLATAKGCVAVDPFGASESGTGKIRGVVFGVGETVYCAAEVEGARWFGTGKGVYCEKPGAVALERFVPFAKVLTVSGDSRGVVYIGADCGLIQYHPANRACWLYLGGDHSDGAPDWAPIDPGATALPRPAGELFMPEVTAVHRGQDQWLWIGTTAGIARYGATAREKDAYTTNLTAFPLLGTGEVFDIKQDERGRVWFCTESGLVIHDGRDFYQVRGTKVVRLVAPQTDQEKMLAGNGIWRFDRQAEVWQQYGERDDTWREVIPELLVSDDGPVFSSLCFDTLSADIGLFDGNSFTGGTAVPTSNFSIRFKVNARRIITGGVPAIPRLPPGPSTWRYLRLEKPGEVVTDKTMRWSSEGRQLFGTEDEKSLPPARFDDRNNPRAVLDGMVYGFLPAARVWLSWNEPAPCTVLVRITPLKDEDIVDSIVLDRVWQGLDKVRPAGVRMLLAVNETIVRGNVL